MKLMEAGILVVDDNREMCSLVQNICRQEGFNRVEAAFSSREAESMVGGGGVDLIILDVNMPGEDGFSFFQRIKPVLEQKRIPVLFLSARDQDEDKLLGLGLGADDYMTKTAVFSGWETGKWTYLQALSGLWMNQEKRFS